MKNRKINLDRPQLNADEITAGKNFDSVVRNHQIMSKPFEQLGQNERNVINGSKDIARAYAKLHGIDIMMNQQTSQRVSQKFNQQY